MPLQPGTHLGPYEIIDLLGAGGMGEVYRARDARLGRSVAVKVLPAVQASAPTRIERFQREARAAAALNHPNILAVHDVGMSGDGPYIVSELLDGETLREALVPGRGWPVRRVLDVAIQVATGLAAAHARGIVHRDLKPENIFRCSDGIVKILDFGLARLTEAAGAAGEDLDTVTRDHTVLGTVGYMAPEQVRGQKADHRADFFAFGAVLYELLTGRRAFDAETSADVMTAILTEDPADLHALDLGPPHLARIVLRCLEKRSEARFQSASDLAFALQAVSSPDAIGSDVSRLRPQRGTSPQFRRVLAWVLPPLLVGVLGVVAGRLSAPAPPVQVPAAHRLTEFVGLEQTPAISPDGRSVAFTANVGRERQIFVRLVAAGYPLQLTRMAGGCRSPRWSADSSAIVCFAGPAPGEREGTLWEVPALGGAMRRVASSLSEADVRAADGRMVYFHLTSDDRIELVTTASDGSAPAVVAQLAPGSYYWHPRWSPDGTSVAFQKGDGLRFDIFTILASGGEPRKRTDDNALIRGLAWLPDGRGLLYSSSRASTMPYLPTFALWQVGLDGGAGRQLTSDEVSYVEPDVHADGRIAVARLQIAVDLWKYPVDGSPIENVRNATRLTHQTAHVQTPTVSSDGTAVAFLSDSGGHANIWILTPATGELRQITHERDASVSVGVPIWSPDGRSLAFVSSRGNPGLSFGIWTVSPDGGNLRKLVEHGLGAAWSADGRSVYYVERASGAILRVPADGGTPRTVRPDGARNVIGHDGSTLFYLDERPLVDGTAEFLIKAASPDDGPSRVVGSVPARRTDSWQIVNPALSPDGRWLAQPLIDGFTTNIWTLPTSGGEWRQITDFGERVTFIARRVDWSHDGRFIVAAVAEGDADIFLLEGLAPGRATSVGR